MRIHVTGTGLELTKLLRAEVRRRVLLAISRFGSEVQAVTAQVGESKNPLGGVDQRCRVEARLRSGQELRAEAINGEMEKAVGRSTDRLARLVAATLDGGGGQGPEARRPQGSEE